MRVGFLHKGGELYLVLDLIDADEAIDGLLQICTTLHNGPDNELSFDFEPRFG